MQETYSADFATFLNINAALIVGLVATLWTTQIFRSIGAAWGARRIFRRCWRDLADLTAGRRADDLNSWTSLMLDRLALITPRLHLARPSKELEGANALVDLRVGINVIVLRDTRWRTPEIHDMLMRLSEAYAARSRGTLAAFSPGLLAAIDSAITALGRAEGREPAGPQVYASLTGLRRALFPQAAGFAGAQ